MVCPLVGTTVCNWILFIVAEINQINMDKPGGKMFVYPTDHKGDKLPAVRRTGLCFGSHRHLWD